MRCGGRDSYITLKSLVSSSFPCFRAICVCVCAFVLLCQWEVAVSNVHTCLVYTWWMCVCMCVVRIYLVSLTLVLCVLLVSCRLHITVLIVLESPVACLTILPAFTTSYSFSAFLSASSFTSSISSFHSHPSLTIFYILLHFSFSLPHLTTMLTAPLIFTFLSASPNPLSLSPHPSTMFYALHYNGSWSVYLVHLLLPCLLSPLLTRKGTPLISTVDKAEKPSHYYRHGCVVRNLTLLPYGLGFNPTLDKTLL